MRDLLTRAVTACRRALLHDRQLGDNIADLLEAPYGFDRSTGVPRPLASLTNLRSDQRGPARQLREWYEHVLATAAGQSPAERARAAFEQMQYELAYTVLHRLCALRMAEERGFTQPCVSEGMQSMGFRLYLQLAGDALGSPEVAYPVFLERVFDEFAWDLPSVFDRRTPASAIFPGPRTLQSLLTTLGAADLAPVWREDETLGWIFQDFNDPAERRAMREAGAPRNVRELAVRNQFFTPRWVVEFLTDNTLGRLWFDVTQGKTELADYCRYLAVKDPDPAGAEVRDPRDIKVLDPACGSGHFLVYAFEVLERIYVEAWERQLPAPQGREAVWRTWPDRAAYLAEVPVLILENNLYGIDIDARCIQEAALTLWLRAQKSFKALGLRPAQRPRVRKVNLVCPHPMAGSPALLEEFLGDLKPAVLGRLVRALIERVGEMGILQRTETVMAEVIAQVKGEYRSWKAEQGRADNVLFEDMRKPKQMGLGDFVELRGLDDDEKFWGEAEGLVQAALGKLGEKESGEHLRRRLFAEDMRAGLEFFDVTRLKFDAILMNPPFGEASAGTKAVLDLAYPNSAGELYAMFFERTLEMVGPRARVGAITSRSWIALPSLARLREQVFGIQGGIDVVADLGYGVLDAKVETAAAVFRRGGGKSEPAIWIRLVKTSRKMTTLLDSLADPTRAPAATIAALGGFQQLPSNVFAYWMSDELLRAYSQSPALSNLADVRQGTVSGEDGRFLRLCWEVEPHRIRLDEKWLRFAKGGKYRLFFDDVHLVVKWLGGGREVFALGEGRPQNISYFGRVGTTWPRRNKGFGPRVLPAGCGFSDKAPTAFPVHTLSNLACLGVLASTPVSLLLSIRLGIVDDDPKAISPAFEVGLAKSIPVPALSEIAIVQLEGLAYSAVGRSRLGQIDDETGETISAFASPPVLAARPATLVTGTQWRVAGREGIGTQLATIQAEIDDLVATAYGFSDRDRQVMDEELEPALANLPGTHEIPPDLFRTAYLTKLPVDGSRLPGGLEAESDVRVEHRRGKQQTLRSEEKLCRLFDAPPEKIAAIRRELNLLRPEDLHRSAADILSYAVGLAFGRWDIRLWQNPSWIPTWLDPFGAMPPCPIGQLVGPDALPAASDRIASPAWRAAWKDASNPPTGIADDTVTAADYPLTVAWEGWLVDDTLGNPGAETFLSRVGATLEFLFGRDRPTWEHDMCEALGVRTAADWFRGPANFFADHLSRYSKSRRRAPIYWPIATQSGRLTVWVYGPRFDAKLVAALINWLRADCERLRDDCEETERRLNETLGREATELRDRAQLLRSELRERQDLRDRIADLERRGYRPHPDDGFAVTLSPLAFAFRHAPWRTYLEETYAELEAQKLDWAHLAMQFWPARVREKCRTDKSLSIAHGLEDLYVEPEGKGKRKGKVAPPAAPSVAGKASQQDLLGWSKEQG